MPIVTSVGIERWSTIESAPWAAGEVRAALEEGPVADVHTFLRVESDEGWGTVDATWPLAAARLGLPANERFVPGREMRVAADPEELYHVPDDTDPEGFRRRRGAFHRRDQCRRQAGSPRRQDAHRIPRVFRRRHRDPVR